MEVHNQRQVATDCSICAKTFTNPKILPCIHTFCSKCLESIASRAKKIPGDNMQCPVCTKEFSIPKEGLAKLQKNFFIERLVTLRGILNTNDRVCDACMEGIVKPLAVQTASVRSYCFNCSMKLCDDCCKHHRRSRLTETHKLVEIADQTITVQLMEMFAPSICEQHENEGLKLCCTDCESSICSLCYIESHQGHRFSEIRVAAHEFRTKLRISIDDILTWVERIKPKLKQLEEHKNVTVKQIGSMKNEIEKRRCELKRLVDKHADSLITKLGVLKEEKLKEIETKKGNINQHNICLESYKWYTSELAEKAMDSDICQAVKSITARALELKEMADEITQHHHPPFQAAFWKTNLEEFISLDSSNIVGTIQADKYDKSKEIPADRNAEKIKELLTKIKQLTYELKSERSNSQKHQEKIKNFSQKLDSERTSKSSLQELVDKLKQDLTRETAGNRKHKEQVDKLQQDLQNEQVRLRELIACKDASSSKVSELEKAQREEKQEWMMKEKSLSDKVTELRVDVAIANQATEKVQKQLEDERKEKKTLDSKIKQCLQNEKEFIKENTEFANKEKRLKELTHQLTYQEREMSQAMHKLKQEVASERTISNSLKAENRELQEQHKILQAGLESLLMELDSKANLIRTVRTLQEREQKDRIAAEAQLRSTNLQLEQKKLLALTEHNTDKKKIQELKEKLIECNTLITSERQKFKKHKTELEKLLFKARPETIDYKDVKATTSFISSLVGRSVTGLTIVDNTLYVTTEQSHVIESCEFYVVDTSPTFHSRREFSVAALSDPRDIKGTKRDCLYIFDQKSHGQPNEIVKFDLNLKSIQKRWRVGGDCGSLSITHEGNVILTVHNKNKLKEYTSDGQLLHEIRLSSEVSNPIHSLKLTSGHFVVSCQNVGMHLAYENGEVGRKSGICIVDENGDVLRSCGEENESWLDGLCNPCCLAIDSSGSIMVSDETSCRVLLLTSTLEFNGELVSGKNGLSHPTKIHLDESNGPRLFVVDEDRIHLFKFAPHPVTMEQVTMEKIVKYLALLAGIMPRLNPAREVNENLLRVLQSQGTLFAAQAFEGLTFLFIIVAFLLFLVSINWFQK